MPPSEVAADMQQRNNMAKKATVRKNRASKKPVVKPTTAEARKAEEVRAAEARKAEARKAEARKAEAAKRKPTILENPRPEYAQQPENNRTSIPWWILLLIGLLVLALLVAVFWPRGNAPAPVAPAAAEAPAAPVVAEPVKGSDYQGAEGCQDGKIISNQFADISRIPIGTLEGAVVAEISWTGSGFGGFDRAIVIVPSMNAKTMAFVRGSKTIHLVQYCGFLKDILAWAPTHVDALVQSSQDDAGNRPDPDEIGVYFLDLNGSWQVVREGPLGPGLDFIKQRVVMTVH